MRFFDGIATELQGEPASLKLWQRYLLAVLVVIFAILARYAIAPIDDEFAFLTFYPAVVISAVLFGVSAGLVTLALSAVAAYYLFVSIDRIYAVPLFMCFGALTCLFILRLRVSLAEAFAKLSRTEQRLQESQRIARIGSWEWERAADTLIWSDETFRIYGIERGVVPSSVAKESGMIHTEDGERLVDLVEGAQGSGACFDTTRRVTMPNGKQRLIQILGHVEYCAEGKPTRAVGTAQDVTELRALQEQLRAKLQMTEMDFQGLAAAAGVGIFVTDENGFCTYANPQFEQMVALAPGGALGKGWETATEPENMGQVRDLWLRTVRKQVPNPQFMSSRVVDGQVRWFQVRGVVLPGPDPRRNRFLATFADMTELQNSFDRVRELARRIELVREEERHAIALVLHEGIAQDLFAAQLSLKFLLGEAKGRNGVQRAYDELSATLSKCMASTRQVANDLRPAGLATMRLATALMNHAQQFEQHSGLNVRINEANNFPDLDESTQLIYFRAAQEALRNVARHAAAQSVAVSLSVQQGQVMMEVSDDGVGIDDNAVNKAGSLGLLGIRERFESIGGSVGIRRNPDHGTTITASTPLPTQH